MYAHFSRYYRNFSELDYSNLRLIILSILIFNGNLFCHYFSIICYIIQHNFISSKYSPNFYHLTIVIFVNISIVIIIVIVRVVFIGIMFLIFPLSLAMTSFAITHKSWFVFKLSAIISEESNFFFFHLTITPKVLLTHRLAAQTLPFLWDFLLQEFHHKYFYQKMVQDTS